MSKSTRNTTYRKINVDEYAEDKFEEEATENVSAGPNENEVNQLMAQKKNGDALRLILDNAPILADQVTKDKALDLAIRVMMAYKSSEIEEVVKTLNPQQVDLLMKYIYKGFERSSDENPKALLVWHEKTFATGGLGSIVRVMTDRKQVA